MPGSQELIREAGQKQFFVSKKIGVRSENQPALNYTCLYKNNKLVYALKWLPEGKSCTSAASSFCVAKRVTNCNTGKYFQHYDPAFLLSKQL